jgi:hypothetical protein
MQQAQAKLQRIIANIDPAALLASREILALRNQKVLEILANRQSRGFSTDITTIIGRQRATDAPPQIAIAAARLRDRITFTARNNATQIVEAARAILALVEARSPVVTGFYRINLRIRFNGKEVATIPAKASGRSIITIYAASIYSSPLEAIKNGGILAATAREIAARYPALRIGFGYGRAGRPFIQERPPGYTNRQSAALAVPFITIGGPAARNSKRIARPGVNARRRNRLRGALTRLNPRIIRRSL